MNKSFKDYYADPNYKEKHLTYVKTQIECDCGISVARVNLARHKRTVKHQKTIAIKQKLIDENEIGKLKEEINIIRSLLNNQEKKI